MRDYVAMVRAHWFALAVFTLLGVVVASVAGYAATPEYTAKAELVVVADTGSTADLTQGSDYTQKQIRTFSELATRPIVLQPAIENLGLAATANEVARQLSVTNVLGTNLISIRTTDPDPQVAADLANEVADQLTVAVSGIVPVLENGEKSVRLKSIRTALPPESPSSPNLPVWAVLGAIGGLVAGALAVALREVLDTKVRDAQTAK
ncbi:MAG TPA: Wzz/FepE/Etk N-terminal domain-containing protein, partial [Coriobacteriia bacterium]|nr:Wzz/FepE/Etk N-terminal domain-containing protein [Coriobacteriia bacterium]